MYGFSGSTGGEIGPGSTIGFPLPPGRYSSSIRGRNFVEFPHGSRKSETPIHLGKSAPLTRSPESREKTKSSPSASGCVNQTNDGNTTLTLSRTERV